MLWKNLLNTLGARGDLPVSEPDLADIWARSLNDLADLQIEPYQRAWLQLTRPLGLVENTALIATPNEFAKDQLENRLRVLITNALSRELGRNIQLAVIIDPAVTAALPVDDAQSGADPLGIRMPFGTSADRAAEHDPSLPHSGDEQRTRGGQAEDMPGRTDPGRADGFGMGHGPLPLQPGPAGLPHLSGHRAGQLGDGPDVANGHGLGAGRGAGVGPGIGSDRPGENGHQADRLPGLPGSGAVASGAGLGAGGLSGNAIARSTLTRLNPKYTFETFVIGSSNRFAHAAAVAVAEAPAKAYNPLFIYGDSGLGKTHLLHAIGHYAQSLYQGVRVRYVSSEEFTNDFINMIRDGKQDGFRRRYRDVDVLLVDDIQFLENKEG